MTNRSVVVFTALLLSATTAQAGNQLFEGSWTVKSFGNECRDATDPTPGPYCGKGYSESEFYSAFGIPQGYQCNPNQPRCPFASTPSNGTGMFATLGGSRDMALFCAPWSNWNGGGATARPAKGDTVFYGGAKIPPLYRNPAFFTAGGEPNTTLCTATSTGVTPGGKGLVQAGHPITGLFSVITYGAPRGGFTINPALKHPAAVRTTGQVGEFNAVSPYVYRYTYATLRNDLGFFGPGFGPGSFNFPYKAGTNTVARVSVKQGAEKFGGTMRMLGALTSKSCYYRNGGCSLAEWNWRYDAIGTSALTSNGVVTHGYTVFWLNRSGTTYCPPSATCRTLYGYRFPWTTGSVTVTAGGSGPHKTVHYAHGYDNRTSVSGKGTIQMVSPTLTRWISPGIDFKTGGIGILRIVVPEPQGWIMLLAGVALLGVGCRMRGH
jgi:hypothetical protein